MIKLVWDKKELNFEKIEWSGSHNQSSRTISFTLPSNPYYKDFEDVSIKLGDIVTMKDGSIVLFVGVITSREKTAEVGTASYVAKDFMHYLLRSTVSCKFTNTTAESITRYLCNSLDIKTSNLEITNINIPKLIFEEKSIYDIIIKAYRKAYAQTKKKYMLVMNGQKVSVIAKGQASGVTLDQNENITAASYSDTTDNMVNIVKIYNDELEQVGVVKNNDDVNKYGHYQSAYKKEEDVDARKEAEAMLVGITKQASVEAIGDVRALAGYSIIIKDAATGLSGKFYIESDTHTFENGVHTMSLTLSWNNVMEEGAETATENDIKKEQSGDGYGYYLADGTVYHSSTSCAALKGKTPTRALVSDIQNIKISKGDNAGKSKYKACSKCWR